jgi:putative aldouronate transport system permease protein
LYLFVFPALVYYFIFHYIPMYGVQIAFRDYMATLGFGGSPWVGFKHFERFFNSFEFWRLIRNTVTLSFFQLLFTFPVPIIVALMLNYLRSRRYKRFVQTVLYAPHFISQVVLVGIVFVFLSPRSGLVNHLIESMGGERIFFMAEAGWFKPLYVGTSVWQGTGWNSIIYLAALSAISPELHEAAICDGAKKLQRIWHIDIPGIMPTAMIILILSMGRLMNIGFEKAYLMQTSLNISASEIIPTYVYKTGLLGAQFSFSTAVELFNSVINLMLLLAVNRIAKRFSETSLW